MNADGVPKLLDPYERRSLAKLEYEMDDLGALSSELKLYTYYQDYQQERETRVESASTFGSTVASAEQGVFGGGIQNVTPWSTSWGEHKFIYGLDDRSENIGIGQTLQTYADSTGMTANSVPYGKTPSGTYAVLDLFLMAELKPAERWTFNTGGRFTSTHLHSHPEPGDVIPNAGYSIEDIRMDRTWNSWTWSVGSVYQITPELDAVGNIATGFRAPTFSDALSTGTPVYSSRVASVPSPNVEPEKSITYEIGPRFHTEHWNASLTAYWTELTDVIQSSTNGSPITIPGQGVFLSQQNINAGSGYVRGLESAASFKPVPVLTLFGNATYTEGWDETDHVYYRYIPPLNGRVGIRYEAPSGRWWAEAVEVLVDTLRHHAPGDQTDAGFSRDPAYGSPSATNPPLNPAYQIPGYAVTNLRAGARVWQDAHMRRFDLTLDVNNLFNTSYREAYAQQELVAPGLDVILGGRLTF